MEDQITSRRNFVTGALRIIAISCATSMQGSAHEIPNMTQGDLSVLGDAFPEETHYLGQVFNNTTNSYKLFWFLSIVEIVSRNASERLPLNEIFAEMVVSAWHPVSLFRLSLGRQDKLQDLVQEVQLESGLANDAKPTEVRKWILASNSISAKLDFFRRYVPTRFLTPWFGAELSGVRDDLKRTKLIVEQAALSQRQSPSAPYFFEDDAIVINTSWLTFFRKNFGVVKAFAEHNLTLFLQARNPNIPSVVNKLRAPSERNLNEAKKFWGEARLGLLREGRGNDFVDIYTDKELGEKFSIDHFLPWSFVAHDLLWNLVPVDKAVNSSKGNTLPDLDEYMPRFARIHLAAIHANRKKPRLLEQYLDCFQLDNQGLLRLGEEEFLTKYRSVIVPQSQLAMNQGFAHGWRFVPQ
ncbi:HNH endonuclease domain-containing protein [Haloferula sp. A504]|uniref:HNH endonuclease domain-containing protein n=1 Tax=Haloferula sp. A504 TaxID=3373601 RepID=UPI0031C9DCCB|nr:hypothetical protein [Verrucomicrobiaceae bacterium E54]